MVVMTCIKIQFMKCVYNNKGKIKGQIVRN